ncbi:hypothetical protein NECAME_11927 [Necator americanus]|uniref:Uncharacterized protein n=1 Tax=Necator americanus TaxID=51031 RepID=W2T555_NECAM|nr:hypothetical protein NECAME_11927 [Necator americanus]ETN76102.1 hypothetical protein NECAME_11927 [Necator americanus]
MASFNTFSEKCRLFPCCCDTGAKSYPPNLNILKPLPIQQPFMTNIIHFVRSGKIKGALREKIAIINGKRKCAALGGCQCVIRGNGTGGKKTNKRGTCGKQNSATHAPIPNAGPTTSAHLSTCRTIRRIYDETGESG